MPATFKLDRLGILIAIFTFFFSFFFFYFNTDMFIKCLVAAVITTALVTFTYIVIKWFYEAL